MTQTISGNLSEPARLLILNESDMSIEHNATTSGSYEVSGLSDGNKVVLARAADGETFGYASVSGVTNVGISIPYFNDFSDQTDQELINDPMWVSETAYFDASATSYNSTWTGGLVMNTSPGEEILSEFYLRGDFTDLAVEFSPTNGWNTGSYHGIFLNVRDIFSSNIVNIFMTRSSGNFNQIQSNNNNSWNYNHYKNTSDLEELFKISRTGNTFYIYVDDSQKASITLNNAPQDMQIRVSTGTWSGDREQDYLIESISIEDATIAYPEVIGGHIGADFADPDPSIWTRTAGTGYIEGQAGGSYIYGNKLRTWGIGTTEFVKWNEAITGDFTIAVDWDFVQSSSSTWWVQYLHIEDETGNKAYIGRFYSGAQRIRFAYYNGSTWNFDNYISSTATNGTFSITRTGNTVKLWHQNGYFTVPISLSGDITLSLGAESSGPSIIVEWDNILVIKE
jgi:hypothetical protein